MNIDWKKIEKECPKSYEKILVYLNNIPGDYIICYCDLEKFFDENGIIININKNYICKPDNVDFEYYKNSWNYNIIIQDKIPYYQHTILHSRDEAKLEAVYKAFEIMEKLL